MPRTVRMSTGQKGADYSGSRSTIGRPNESPMGSRRRASSTGRLLHRSTSDIDRASGWDYEQIGDKRTCRSVSPREGQRIGVYNVLLREEILRPVDCVVRL